MTAYPLPLLGLCPVCEGEIRIRKNGVLYVHGCAGDGREPVARLRPTFARWLHNQTGRGVDHEDRVSELAHWVFANCGRTRQTPVEVPWTTADELHTFWHERDRILRDATEARPCFWLCRDIERAAGIYARLVAAESLDGAS